MKLTPAYQIEQEAKKVFEEQCRDLYFDHIDSIEKDIEYWKNKGRFNFCKNFHQTGNHAVDLKVRKMMKKLLAGYGYKVWFTYPEDHIVMIEISWKENYFSLLWKKIKQNILTICPKRK